MTIAAEAKVLAEIWSSFVGVLRSYAAIASTHVSVHSIDEDAVATAVVESGDAYLSFAIDTTDGHGSYRLVLAGEVEGEEHFRLDRNGTISPEVGPAEDLDHAAIRLLGLLSKAAAKYDIEVPA